VRSAESSLIQTFPCRTKGSKLSLPPTQKQVKKILARWDTKKVGTRSRLYEESNAVRRLLEFACEVFGVNVVDLVSSSRRRVFVTPRQVVFAVLHRDRFIRDIYTLGEIGKIFNRDHATVIHGSSQCDDLRATEVPLERMYQEVRSAWIGFIADDLEEEARLEEEEDYKNEIESIRRAQTFESLLQEVKIPKKEKEVWRRIYFNKERTIIEELCQEREQ